MISSAEEFLHFHLTLQLHHSIQYGFGARRATGDIHIHGHQLVDASHHGVALLERTARNGATANSHYILGLCYLVVETLEDGRHLIGYRTGAHDEVGLTSRVTCHLKAEA